MLEGSEAGSVGTFKCKVNSLSAIKTYLQDINSTSSSRPTFVLNFEAAIMRSIAPFFLVVLQSLIIGSNASKIFDRDSGPLCNVCSNDIGICCPPGIVCGSDGKCPPTAVANAGYTIGDSAEEVETFVQSQDGEHVMEYGGDNEENAPSGPTPDASMVDTSSAASESTPSAGS